MSNIVSSPDQGRATTQAILAQYRPRSQYTPIYGDYFVWSKWVTTWHGIVTNYDPMTDEISILVSGVPFLLLTMAEERQAKETIKVKLTHVRQARNGKFAILQQDKDAQNANIWYI